MFNICVDLDFLGVERVLCILELLCQNSWGNKLSQLDTFDPISNFPIVHCCQNIALPMRRFRVYTFSASVRWCTFHLPCLLTQCSAGSCCQKITQFFRLSHLLLLLRHAL